MKFDLDVSSNLEADVRKDKSLTLDKGQTMSLTSCTPMYSCTLSQLSELFVHAPTFS